MELSHNMSMQEFSYSIQLNACDFITLIPWKFFEKWGRKALGPLLLYKILSALHTHVAWKIVFNGGFHDVTE